MRSLLKIILIFTILFSSNPLFAKKKIKDRGPIAIVTVAPNYPRAAAEQGIEGEVTLEFTITTTGTVTNPVVIASNPEKLFDREALRAILKYKFAPAIKKQKAIQIRVSQTLSFKLPDGYQPHLIDK